MSKQAMGGVPLKPHKRMDHVYVIIRVDSYPGLDVPDEERISVKEILWDADVASREVDRLNSSKKANSRYFMQTTRLERRNCAPPSTTADAVFSFGDQGGMALAGGVGSVPGLVIKVVNAPRQSGGEFTFHRNLPNLMPSLNRTVGFPAGVPSTPYVASGVKMTADLEV